MVDVVEYVDKEQFDKLRKRYPRAKYELNHEFPETERLLFLFVPFRFAVIIKHELEGQ
jgi:hypothetical protein